MVIYSFTIANSTRTNETESTNDEYAHARTRSTRVLVLSIDSMRACGPVRKIVHLVGLGASVHTPSELFPYYSSLGTALASTNSVESHRPTASNCINQQRRIKHLTHRPTASNHNTRRPFTSPTSPSALNQS
jgi:hypothetical protein